MFENEVLVNGLQFLVKLFFMLQMSKKQCQPVKLGGVELGLFSASMEGNTGDLHFAIADIAGHRQRKEFLNRALHIACRRGHTKIGEVLLQAGAELNCVDDEGITPLMLAAYRGHSKVVELLLGRGALINCKHNQGGTALHITADKHPLRGESILEMLLLSNADVRVADIEMKSALDVATEALSEYLEMFGATSEPSDDDGSDAEEEETLTKSISLLYAAGASLRKISLEYVEDHRDLIPGFIWYDQEVLLTLTGLCRRHIRTHLLSATGGNYNNLITAVPKLPLPTRLKDFLLFNVDMPERIPFRIYDLGGGGLTRMAGQKLIPPLKTRPDFTNPP